MSLSLVTHHPKQRKITCIKFEWPFDRGNQFTEFYLQYLIDSNLETLTNVRLTEGGCLKRFNCIPIVLTSLEMNYI